MLLLASGYLFTAVAAIIHALTFPGLFTPTGLFNSGPQTTAWLYQIWHAGFPLLAIGYAVLKDEDGGPKIGAAVGRSLFGSIVAVGVTLSVATWIVTVRHDLLPTLLSGPQGRFTPILMGILSTELLLSFAAC